MLNVNIERFNNLALVVCKGRIVQSDDVFKFRDFALAQEGARVIALDMSEVEALGGGGLGMLAYLQHWADEHDIELNLLSPSSAVLDQLSRTSGVDIHITNPIDLMSTQSHDNHGYSLAA
jgi:anti-anti-sigma regulatory factor